MEEIRPAPARYDKTGFEVMRLQMAFNKPVKLRLALCTVMSVVGAGSHRLPHGTSTFG